jgi:hypothetical protein
MQIYDYLLTEEYPVEIDVIHRRKKADELVRHGRQSKRNWRHRFEVWDKNVEKWVTVPPIKTAILFVCKQFHAEAVRCLYGENCFAFKATTGLRQSLPMLGDHAQYLRYVKIDDRGYARTSIRPALKLLKVATGLKSIEMGYRDMLTRRSPQEIAADFRSFLLALQKSRKGHDVSANVLEVLKIGSFDYRCGRNYDPWTACGSCGKGLLLYHDPSVHYPLYSGCICDQEALRVAREVVIRSEIARSLGIEE